MNTAAYGATGGTAWKGKVPPWLAELGIKEGQYFTDSKLRAKRAMRSKCFSPAARVHICLGLHTMGYQQELAVTMEAGKKIPLTPSHVAAETGLKKQNVRPAMLELQSCGLGKIEGSTHGRVKLYAWAVPRQPDAASRSNSRHYFVEHAPPWLQCLLKRYRIRPPNDGEVLSRGYLEAVQDASRKYREAEEVLKRTLKGNGAPAPLNKEEINERNIERNPPPSVGRSSSEESEESANLPTTAVSEENPLKAKTKEWMLSNLPVPGFALEDAEFDKIAATIHSEEDLEQFEQAAVRQKDPRGWRVYVRIAERCSEQRPHYQKAKAAAVGANAGGSPEPEKSNAVRELREKEERRKSWPTG